jgi:hypothetical protein
VVQRIVGIGVREQEQKTENNLLDGIGGLPGSQDRDTDLSFKVNVGVVDLGKWMQRRVRSRCKGKRNGTREHLIATDDFGTIVRVIVRDIKGESVLTTNPVA